MAITSVGYDGTINETQWAALATRLGTAYGVEGKDDLKVTAVAGSDRTVAIAAGTGYGWGVRDTNSAQVTLQLGTISSGTRWDLIALRRNWQTNTSSFVVVAGTNAQVVPPGRLTSPGVQADQPIALAQVTAGQTAITGLLDLRQFCTPVITAGSLLAVPDAGLGAEVVVGTTRYRQVLDNTNALVWTAVDDTARSATADFHWGGSTYNWTIPNTGTATAAPGSTTTVSVYAGHLYEIKSLFVIQGGIAGAEGTVNASVWAGTTQLRNQPYYAQAAASEGSGELTGFWQATATGNASFSTRFSTVSANMRVFYDPMSYIVDHGLRP